MLDGDDKTIAGGEGCGERRVRRLDGHGHVGADELQLPVRPQHAGEEARLAEDLEPVADPEHRRTVGGELAHDVHHRCDARQCAAPQVVAVREPPGQDDAGDARVDLRRRVPDGDRLRAEVLERKAGVPVVVRAGERHDGDPGTRLGHAVLRSDLEALDQGIGQELGAHPLDLRACGRHIAVLDLQLDEATDARTCHCESEGRKRRLHRLALRVEDAGLRADENRELHSTTAGSSRYRSKGISVRRTNAST